MAAEAPTYISEMRAKGRAEGRVEGRAEGRVEGYVNAVLLVLEVRSLAVTDAERERITGCTDTGQLETWLWRVGTAASVDEVLA